MRNEITPYLLVFVGIFTLSGGVMNWQWFMNHRKARPFVRILGPMGARVFYALLGLVCVTFGLVLIIKHL